MGQYYRHNTTRDLMWFDAPVAGYTAIPFPASGAMSDLLPWFRALVEDDQDVSAKGWHPLNYYSGGAEISDATSSISVNFSHPSHVFSTNSVGVVADADYADAVSVFTVNAGGVFLSHSANGEASTYKLVSATVSPTDKLIATIGTVNIDGVLQAKITPSAFDAATLSATVTCLIRVTKADLTTIDFTCVISYAKSKNSSGNTRHVFIHNNSAWDTPNSTYDAFNSRNYLPYVEGDLCTQDGTTVDTKQLLLDFVADNTDTTNKCIVASIGSPVRTNSWSITDTQSLNCSNGYLSITAANAMWYTDHFYIDFYLKFTSLYSYVLISTRDSATETNGFVLYALSSGNGLRIRGAGIIGIYADFLVDLIGENHWRIAFLNGNGAIFKNGFNIGTFSYTPGTLYSAYTLRVGGDSAYGACGYLFDNICVNNDFNDLSNFTPAIHIYDTGSAYKETKVYDGTNFVITNTNGTNGTNGLNAIVFDISKDADLFYFDSNGDASPSSQTINFSAVKQGITDSTSWSIQIKDSSGANVGTAITGTGESINLTNSQFAAAGVGGLYADIVATAGSYTASTKIYKSSAGSAGIRGWRVFYSEGNYSAWDSAVANAQVVTDTGSSFKLTNDTAIIYNPTTKAIFTRYWSGSSDTGSWIIATARQDGNLIVDGTVNASKVAANFLSALFVEAGSISVGKSLELANGAALYSGMTGYKTGVGYWLDNNGNPRFSLGSFTGTNDKGITYDATDGFKQIGQTINASNLVSGLISLENLVISNVDLANNSDVDSGTGYFTLPAGLVIGDTIIIDVMGSIELSTLAIRKVQIFENFTASNNTFYDFYTSPNNADSRLISVSRRIVVTIGNSGGLYIIGVRLRQNSGSAATANLNLTASICKK